MKISYTSSILCIVYYSLKDKYPVKYEESMNTVLSQELLRWVLYIKNLLEDIKDIDQLANQIKTFMAEKSFLVNHKGYQGRKSFPKDVPKISSMKLSEN